MSIPGKTGCVLVYFLLFAGCSGELSPPPLIIASDATFAPFHWLDKSGKATGFDIELARAVATTAGFEPQVEVLAYDALFSGLLDNTHDIVAATTGITPEREQLYLFSQPYYKTCQVAVVRAGTAEPRSIAELAGTRIGASGAGTSVKATKTLDGVLISIDDGQGVTSLDAGLIDAWIVDEFDGIAAARESSGRLRVLPEPIAEERYGFVLAPERLDLKTRLDSSLAQLVEDGTMASLRRQFGVDRSDDWPVECGTAPSAAKNPP